MAALILLHVAVAAAAMVWGRLGRRVFWLAAVAPAVTFVWALAQAPSVIDGAVPTAGYDWVAGLGLTFAFRLNGFALLMTLLVSGIGVLVFVYAARYFHDEAHLGRFAATLALFAGSMLGLVLSDNVLGLFVFWELTSITSYFLIGFNDERESARTAALQALLITGAGGLALLFGLLIIGNEAGTYSLTAIVAAPPRGMLVNVGLVAVLAGCFTKSAQVPFHGWLPGAMAAPTPVSAYLHSATMVKAGIFVIAIFAPAFATAGPWRPLTVTVGVVTMLWAGYQQLRRNDMKLLLAYGTIAALGAMVVLFGIGLPQTTYAGVALLFGHAMYKAALFMVAGIVDHQTGTRDIRKLSRVGHRLRGLAVVAVVAGASMAAIPATFGFVGKEVATAALLDAPFTWANAGLVALLTLGALTVAAVFRLLWGAFADKGPDGPDPTPAHPVPPLFLAPPAVLAAIGLVLGVRPELVNGLVNTASASLQPVGGGDFSLHAFPGLNLAFGLSMAALAGGAALIVWRRPVARLQHAMAVGPNAGAAFRATVAALLRFANRIARVVQNGSLPVYLGVILLTFVALPGAVIAGSLVIPDGAVLAESTFQAIAAAMVIISALGVVLTNRRFAAVLLLGTVGYGVAVLFIIQGAPDLALTQFLVETATVVVFVLVLRKLPEHFDPSNWRGRQVLRIVISAGVGAFVFAFILITSAARTADPPTDQLIERAGPDGGGQNVVNVILTDIRALDTLGEITVLAIAAIGVISLVRYTTTPGRREEDGDDGDGDDRDDRERPAVVSGSGGTP